MFKKSMTIIFMGLLTIFSHVQANPCNREAFSTEKIEQQSNTVKQKKGSSIKPILVALAITAGFGIVFVTTALVLAAAATPNIEKQQQLLKEYQQEQQNLRNILDEQSQHTREKIDTLEKEAQEGYAKREAEQQAWRVAFEKLSPQEKLKFSNQLASNRISPYVN